MPEMQKRRNCGKKNQKTKNILRLRPIGRNAILLYGTNRLEKNAQNADLYLVETKRNQIKCSNKKCDSV